MYKFVFLFAFVFILSQNSFADCHTGFACNLQQLQEEEIKKYQSFISLINKYFEKRYIEKDYISDKFNILSYNDMFVFNTIL